MKGSQSFSNGPPGSLSGAASEGPSLVAQSWLLWSNTAGHLSQLSVSTRRVMLSTTSYRSFFFPYKDFLAGLIPGYHRVISAPLPYSASHSVTIIFFWVPCWSNSLSNPMECLKQSFLPTAVPSYCKGLRLPPTSYLILSETLEDLLLPFPHMPLSGCDSQPHLLCFLSPSSFLNFTTPFQNYLRLLLSRTLQPEIQPSFSPWSQLWFIFVCDLLRKII